MSHQFESGFFVKEPAWHELGTVLRDAPTISEGIIAAGLDWQVIERPVYWFDDEDNRHQATEYINLVRDRDNVHLGVVGKKYKPLQNMEAFQWFDFLLHDGDAILEAAGSLKNGKRIWVLAKVNTEALEVRDGDLVNPYLLLHNSHDGTTAVWINFTPIRVVCKNTLTIAANRGYSDAKIGKALNIRHSSSLNERMSTAKNSMDFARQLFPQSLEQYRAIAKKRISLSDFDRYLELVLDIEKACDHRDYESILANFGEGRGNRGETYWDAYNGVTEWLDHQRGRTPETRLESAWFGDSAKVRAKAHEIALSICT
jgi:phage/plasmid-like protein (TIGR03299 family)